MRTRSKKSNNDHESLPTALQRIHRARTTLHQNVQLPFPKEPSELPSHPLQNNDEGRHHQRSATDHPQITMRGINPKIQFLLCPHASQRALTTNKNSKSITEQHNENINTRWSLQKPPNRSKLLQRSLTNSNGAEWERQRGIVARTLGGQPAKKARQTGRDAAAKYARRFVREIVELRQHHNHDKKDGDVGRRREAVRLQWRRLWSCYRGGSVDYRERQGNDDGGGGGSIGVGANGESGTIDVRKLALNIATHAISVAVVGLVNAPRVQHLLRNMFLCTLQPKVRAHDASICSDSLDQAVRDIVEGFTLDRTMDPLSSSSCTEDNCSKEEERECDENDVTDSACDYDCLAYQLWMCETSAPGDSSTTTTLDREEVVANIHSALMAGTQTTCTTLAGALLHLSEREDLLFALKGDKIRYRVDDDGFSNNGSEEHGDIGSSTSTSSSSSSSSYCCLNGTDIVMETLRIFPPVGGLPRIPVTNSVNIPLKSSGCDQQTLAIKKDETIIVDLLALAHAQERPLDENDSLRPSHLCSTFSTIMFRPKTKERVRSHAQPWGIGERRCPAGLLSVECVSAVLESLVKEGFTWTLANPVKDSKGPDGVNGWVENVSYLPTLSYLHPIPILFSLKSDSACPINDL